MGNWIWFYGANPQWRCFTSVLAEFSHSTPQAPTWSTWEALEPTTRVWSSMSKRKTDDMYWCRVNVLIQQSIATAREKLLNQSREDENAVIGDHCLATQALQDFPGNPSTFIPFQRWNTPQGDSQNERSTVSRFCSCGQSVTPQDDPQNLPAACQNDCATDVLGHEVQGTYIQTADVGYSTNNIDFEGCTADFAPYNFTTPYAMDSWL